MRQTQFEQEQKRLKQARKILNQREQDLTKAVSQQQRAETQLTNAKKRLDRAPQSIKETKKILDEARFRERKLRKAKTTDPEAIKQAQAEVAEANTTYRKALQAQKNAARAEKQAQDALKVAKNQHVLLARQIERAKQELSKSEKAVELAENRLKQAQIMQKLGASVKEHRYDEALEAYATLSALPGEKIRSADYLYCIALSSRDDGPKTIQVCQAAATWEPQAQRYLLKAHLSTKHYEQALALLPRAKPAAEDYELLIMVGMALAEKGQYPQAADHLRRGLKGKVANRIDALHLLGRAYHEQGQLDSAKMVLQQVYEQDSTRDEVRYRLAKIAQAQGDNNQAKKLITSYLGDVGTGGSADRSVRACQRDLFQVVTHEFTVSLPRSPDKAAAHVYAGIMELEGGRINKAQMHFDTALGLKPKDISVLYNAGLFNVHVGRYDKARGQLDAVLKQDANRMDARVNLAVAELRDGNGQKSIAILEGAKDLDDHGKIVRAVALARDGERVKVQQLLKSIEPTAPLGQVAIHNLAVLELQEGNFDAAQDLTTKITTPFEEVHRLRAQLAIQQGKPKDAVAQLRKALALNGGYLRARIELGQALQAADEATEAVAELRRAVALDPSCTDAHVYLGTALGKNGDPTGEAAEYQKAEMLWQAARRKALREAGTDIDEEQKKKVNARRVAVVRFLNTANDPQFEWLALGIPEALSTDINTLSGVVVVERGQVASVMKEIKFSSLDFVDSSTAPRLNKVLGADAIVVGSFQVIDRTIRIMGRLVDLKTRQVLTSGSVEGEMDKIFELQRRLAVDLVGNIAQIKTEERANLLQGPDASVSALQKLALMRTKMLQGDKAGARSAYREAMQDSSDYVGRLDNLKNAYQDVSATLAAVPFQNLHRNPEQDWLGEGIAASLATDMRKIGIFVVERMAIAKVIKEQKFGMIVDPQQASKLGKHIGASIILLGSYQQYDDILMINARMVEVETGAVMLTERVAGKSDEFFALQAQLADAIAETLRMQVSPEEIAALTKDKPDMASFKESILKNRLFVIQAPKTETKSSESEKSYLWPAVIGASGVAMGITGGLLYGFGHSASSRADMEIDQYHASSGQVAASHYSRAEDLYDDANVLKGISFAAFGLTAGALTYTIWALVADDEPSSGGTAESTSPSIVPSAQTDGAGVQMSIDF